MNKEQKLTKHYGLLTAVTMIVGIVIGSGIYFKADDILKFTGGNVYLGMLSILIASSCIIFGSLSFSVLAQKTTTSGGLSSYYEKFCHSALAASLGFFTAYMYLPTVIAIVSWVASIYTWTLLNKTVSFETEILLAALYLILLCIMNLFSKVLAGYFQSLSTFVKVIPLVLMAVIGITWGYTQPEIPAHLTIVPPRHVGIGFFSALVPLAFTFDGWTVVASISPEVKDAHKNIPRAFVLGPSIILVLYLSYFYGLNKLLGSTFIMTTGDSAISYAVNLVFGEAFGKVLMLIVIISVLGVANGMLLGAMRLPQAFAIRQWLPFKSFIDLHHKHELSISSSISVALVTLFWLIVHYFVHKLTLIPGSDISEVSIVFNNLGFMILYGVVIKLYLKRDVTNVLTGLIAPILAIIGTLILLIGSLLTNFTMVMIFMLICFIVCLIGYILYKIAQTSAKE